MLFLQDARYSFRSLVQRPGFFIACVALLAVGIGANATIFTAVKAILLDPLPYRDASRLVALYEEGVVANDFRDEPSPANFYDWQHEARSFGQIAAYGGMDGNLSGDGTALPEDLNGAFCSWNLFDTLGIQPAFGRPFAIGDDRPGAPRTIILSYSLWKRRFNGDPVILGKTIRFDVQPYTVIAVMRRSFEFPSAATQFWIPMQIALPPEELQNRQDHRLFVIARLKRGVSIQHAQAELSGIAARIKREHPAELTATSAEVFSLDSQLIDQTVRESLNVLWAAVACVLLIACVNVANLLLARGSQRRREIAIRAALGASRERIVRFLLIEAFMLSVAGAFGGILLAAWLTHALARMSVSLPRASAIALNWPVLLFAVLLAIVSGLAAGLLPAISASDLDLNEAIHEAGRSSVGSIRRLWHRNALVAAEIALSFLLLAGAGLLLKSFVLLQTVNVGFNPSHLLTMRLSLPEAKYPNEAAAANFFERLLDRVRATPGIQNAGLVSWLPVAGQFMNTHITIAGRPPLPPGQINLVIPRTADPLYFKTMGIPLKRGRTFLASERLNKATVAVISEELARRYFPNENPIGQSIEFWKQRWQIIGIVGDVRKNLDQSPEPTVYIPISSGELNFAALVVRTPGDPLSLALPIERQIAHLDPDLAVSDVLTMDQLISKRTADQRFTLILLASFAGLAILLAAAGLYGVVSYSTSQRTSEFGIRLALGARTRDLVELVLRQGLAPAIIGIMLGFAGAVAIVRVMQSMLFEVKPFDATVFLTVGVALLAVSALASLVPALRTTEIDPAQALRTE